MKLFLKAFILIAGIFICFAFPSEMEAKQVFKDVPTNHYAYDAIKWAYDFNIVNGYANGTFRPNQPVTEQQFASILVGYFDLEPVTEALEKFTPNEIPSDGNYNTLAAYGVPLNGYFQNTIRGSAVKRGTVAQAIAYVADGQTTLNKAIQFLLDHDISNGQNPKYEQINVQRFFGASNNLTRAQLVSLFYKMQSKNFFYRSQIAEGSYADIGAHPLYKRANEARNMLDRSLQSGRNWAPAANKPKKTWDGEYTYFYTYGKGDLDSRGRVLTISKSTKENFNVTYYTFDGWSSGTIEGTATLISDTKARMSKTAEGERCVIEFERGLNDTIKTTEFYCEAGRERGTDYNGNLTLEK
ncbi:S-layer homology domain-containing protein [Solibacillus merdavium]|uniref:S-layer homology domain-containing protein n=1 Tax=Solibacillus merdavium TaxID=2762218 RepID=A0ABR8XRU9_9BACL|nr:S-layer homology domain-containing protein [Solibacillus merdavium]MBD8034584.1 S-layer homology domain-containing protein [Solibacillus merdavium]